MRILLIAYYFPPGPDGGGQRPAAFQHHLNRLGHPTAVLTHTYDRFQGSAENEFRIFDPSYCRDHGGRHFFPWALRRGLVLAANLVGRPRTIFSSWKKSALQALPGIIEHFQPDVLLASYPPVETLELGLAAARLSGLPLAADFRDGLLFEPVEEVNLRRHPCLRRHYRDVEAAVCRESVLILAASEAISGYFRKNYPFCRVHTLTNGFEPGGAVPAAEEPGGSIRLVHTGSLALSDPTVSIDSFISALKKLGESHPQSARRLVLEFAGRLSRGERKALLGLGDIIKIIIHGQLPRSQALELQSRADLLLLISSPRRSGHIAGKIFEYLAAARPILALSPLSSQTAALIRRTGCGWTIPPDDANRQTAFLAHLLANPAMISELRRNENAISFYERPRQVAGLATLLEQLLEESRNR